MTDVILDHVTVVDITNPTADVEVLTVGIPGIIGPQGPTGTPGPPNVLTIGSVTTSAPGDSADAFITGDAPNQFLNLVLPQGVAGPAGPAPTLSVGSTTTGAAGTSASVTIDGSAAPAYVLNFTIPQGATGSNGGGVVVGGAVGDVLTKNSTTDYDTKWSTPTSAATASALMQRDASGRAQVADPSANADIATKNYIDNTAGTSVATNSALVRRDASAQANFAKVFGGASIGPTDSANVLPRKDYVDALLTTTQTGTAYTLALTDQRTAVRMNNASNMVVTVPPNSSVAFQTGTWIELERTGAGTLTIAAGTGVTIVSPDSNLTARVVNSRVRLHKVATDTWVVSGDILSSTDATVAAATTSSTANTLMLRDGSGWANAGRFLIGTSTPTQVNEATRKDYVDTQDATMRRPQLNTQTASYTLVLTDERKLVQMNSASATTLTVPLNSSVAFPVGTVLEVQMLGTGNVTIAPAAGVTLNSASANLIMTRQYAVVLLQKTGTDTWNVDRVTNAAATSASTASTLIIRDASGRASVADPSASTDIATKNYADTKASIAGDLGGTAASPQVTSGTHHTHTSKQITPSVSALTDAATIATDASLGNLFKVTVTASRTMGAPTNPTDGQRIMYEVTASGGSWTLTMSSSAGGFKFGTDFTSIPTINTGTTTYIGCMYSSRDSFWHVLAVGSGH